MNARHKEGAQFRGKMTAGTCILEEMLEVIKDLIPPQLPDIHRVSQIKILGITVTNHLSVNDYVRHVICKCGQSIYALKVLRSHDMCDSALRGVYRAVVIAKLLYASSAWWGYDSASDKQ